MYSAEIREQYDCGRCAKSAHEWAQHGRCTGPLPLDSDGNPQEESLTISDVAGAVAYPVRFDACPMSYLREDLRPEAALARIVSHAVSGKAERRWPDLPAKLAALVNEWHGTDADKQIARHEAIADAPPNSPKPPRRRRVRN